jgi:hypothetical protein
MKQDWIAFYYAGEVRLDVVLSYGKHIRYPQDSYAITPHYGKIDLSSVIEIRAAASPALAVQP